MPTLPRPRLRLPLALFPLLLSAGLAQAPTAPAPSFDAATIKASPDMMQVIQSGGKPHVGTRIDAAQVDMGFASLLQMIATAYSLKPYQVDGPDWLNSTHFDVLAKIPAGASQDQVPAMLQAMLKTRFHLTTHSASKELPVYALVVGKDGVKLKPAVDAPAAPAGPPDKDERTIDTPDGPMRIKTTGSGDNTTAVISGGKNGGMTVSMSNGTMHMQTDKMTMQDLADALTPMMDRPVVDATGLQGAYQVTLDLSMADLMAVAQKATATAGINLPPEASAAMAASLSNDPGDGSIGTSLAALGLGLDKRKAPTPTLVVDHMDKQPTDN